MKVTPTSPKTVKVFSTKDKKDNLQLASWWKGKSQDEVGSMLLSTAAYLKETQQYRYRQAAIYARICRLDPARALSLRN